ncbi:MAG: hypothetical protein WBL67_16255 [Nitrososphaeraceae archaeon]
MYRTYPHGKNKQQQNYFRNISVLTITLETSSAKYKRTFNNTSAAKDFEEAASSAVNV